MPRSARARPRPAALGGRSAAFRPRFALALIGLAAGIVVLVVSRTAPDERVAAGPAGAFVAPPLAAPELCGTRGGLPAPATKRAARTLSVLEQTPVPFSAALRDTARTWLPAGQWDGIAHRPAGLAKRFVVLGSDHIRTRPLACGGAGEDRGSSDGGGEDRGSGGGEDRGPGACLVSLADTRAALRLRCFTLDEIRAGRAFAWSGTQLVGLVPDGIAQVELTLPDDAATRRRLTVQDNAVGQRGFGLAGHRIAVRLLNDEPRRP